MPVLDNVKLGVKLCEEIRKSRDKKPNQANRKGLLSGWPRKKTSTNAVAAGGPACKFVASDLTFQYCEEP